MQSLRVFFKYLYFGAISFGGPAAHIALLERELVRKKKELSKNELVELIAFTNIIPGPNSTELVQSLGWKEHGQRGLWLAGAAFILPAFLSVLVLSFLYTHLQKTEFFANQIHWALVGLQPIVIALIASSLWSLRSSFSASPSQFFLFLGSLILCFLKLPAVSVLIIIGLLALLTGRIGSRKHWELGSLFLVFLKIGALLFGSGYVLFSYLHSEFVQNQSLLTSQQILDSIAIGHITPGPLFTSATFVGFLLEGWKGALAATLGIFLPSFLLTALLGPLWHDSLAKTEHPSLKRLIAGLNIASMGLLTFTLLELIQGYFISNEQNFSFEVLLLLMTSLIGSLGLFLFSKTPTWLPLLGGLLLGLAIPLFQS